MPLLKDTIIDPYPTNNSHSRKDFWKPCTLFVSIFTLNYRYWNQVFQELTDIVSSTQPEQLILMFVAQYVSNRSLTIGCYHIYVPHSREYESMAPNKGSQNITLRRRVPIVKIKPFLKKKKKRESETPLRARPVTCGFFKYLLHRCWWALLLRTTGLLVSLLFFRLSQSRPKLVRLNWLKMKCTLTQKKIGCPTIPYYIVSENEIFYWIQLLCTKLVFLWLSELGFFLHVSNSVSGTGFTHFRNQSRLH